MQNYDDLPGIMKERGKWAREQILGMVVDNDKVQIDEDEMLAWVYREEDGRWYSIDGNYSGKSPQEKMKQRREYLKRQEESTKKYDEAMIKRFAEIDHWSKIRQAVLDRDGHACQSCDIEIGKFHIHHILPKRLGGSDHFDNLITVCAKCHRKVENIDAKNENG